HPSNAPFSIETTLAGMYILVSPAPEKALLPTMITLSPIVTDVRALQPEKAFAGIVYKWSSPLTIVKLLLFAKAPSPIAVIWPLKVILVIFVEAKPFAATSQT